MRERQVGSRRRGVKLRIKKLEDKTLLAGDVQVTVHHGDLRITGNGNDTVCMLDVQARRMRTHLGHGIDRLDLGSVGIDERTRLNGGGGNDTLGEDNNSLSGLRTRSFENTDAFADCFDDN